MKAYRCEASVSRFRRSSRGLRNPCRPLTQSSHSGGPRCWQAALVAAKAAAEVAPEAAVARVVEARAVAAARAAAAAVVRAAAARVVVVEVVAVVVA